MQLLLRQMKIALLPPVWKIYHSMISTTTLMNGQRHLLMKSFNLSYIHNSGHIACLHLATPHTVVITFSHV